ncbi:hypothetical protein C8Q75DRAFT_895694 [Abortiporus biennis]|nr:hypothetical protein C8Q75DRAFT_895694 [Abortiporus biennis]
MSAPIRTSPLPDPNVLAVLLTGENTNNPSQRSYAKLLDSLAYLCLYGKKNCVVAVAAAILPSGVELYVAENGGILLY